MLSKVQRWKHSPACKVSCGLGHKASKVYNKRLNGAFEVDKFGMPLRQKFQCPAKLSSIQFCSCFWCIKSIFNGSFSFSSIETGKLATNELPLTEEQKDTDTNNPTNSTSVFDHSTIAEDAEESDSASVQSQTEPQNNRTKLCDKKYTWRINLSKSEQYWAGWFENLSTKFLDLYVPKLLLLASIDGLDRTLTVGQMQGKFQLQVLARCGHAVHEVRVLCGLSKFLFYGISFEMKIFVCALGPSSWSGWSDCWLYDSQQVCWSAWRLLKAYTKLLIAHIFPE